MARIITWQTWKKENSHLQIYSVQDSVKGWVRTIIKPTLKCYGFNSWTGNDIISDNRKPRQILMEDFKYIIDSSELVVYFVYNPTHSYAGFFKHLDIYYK